MASPPDAAERISLLEEGAIANRIRVERLDEKALKEIDLRARSCWGAIFSPDTAAFATKGVLEELGKDLKASGVHLFLDTEVQDLKELPFIVGRLAKMYAVMKINFAFSSTLR